MTTTQQTRAPTPLLSVEEVATRLGVTTRLVRDLIARRTLASVRVGRRVRVKASDVEQYVDEHYTPAREPGR